LLCFATSGGLWGGKGLIKRRNLKDLPFRYLGLTDGSNAKEGGGVQGGDHGCLDQKKWGVMPLQGEKKRNYIRRYCMPETRLWIVRKKRKATKMWIVARIRGYFVLRRQFGTLSGEKENY